MDEDQEIKYKLIITETGKESKSSRDFTGHGKAFYENGETYEGEYVGGKREGYGVYKYKNSYIYEGHFSENLKNGFGKFYHPKKGSYEGEFS